jgi:hypothetical protein
LRGAKQGWTSHPDKVQNSGQQPAMTATDARSNDGRRNRENNRSIT